MAANYNESEKVKRLAEDMALHEAKNPGEWSGGTYGKGMGEALQKVLNRDKFQYDINGDALYQQYKDRYIQQGKQAMMDTVGQAAALTGGYGNSYAQNAGQQAYQGYLQGLNDKVPELYQMALERYNQEGTDLLNKYGLMSDQYAKEYSRYRDSVGDWRAQRDYLATLYNNERNFDYTGYRDRVADEQWQKEFEEAMRQYNQNYAFSQQQYEDSKKSSSSSSSSSRSSSGVSGWGYSTHGYSTADIMALQRNAGIDVDGVWGPDTQAAWEAGYTKDGPPAPQQTGIKRTSSDALNTAIKNAGGSHEGQLLELQAMYNRGEITAKQLTDLAYAITNPSK